MKRTVKERVVARVQGFELLRYLGPGFLVAVGFIDPGNWATNIEGGARFGYHLLWVITVATLMLVLLQNMSARVGIVTGRSLAANAYMFLPPWMAKSLGITVYLACSATEVAEFIGAAIGFKILFGIPPAAGALLTFGIVIAAVFGQKYERLERMIVVFLAGIAFAYLIELVIVKPDMTAAARGIVVPSISSSSILIAMAMLGAVVMPHNIFLHSNLIGSREWSGDSAEKRRLMRFEMVDTTLAMVLGWAVNCSMIVVAAAVFFSHGIVVTDLEQASATLRPLAGRAASLLFGVALLLSGLGSSVTAAISSANIATGFLGRPEDTHSKLYQRGLLIASVPAIILIISNVDFFRTLILSQAVLSMQLPFTVAVLLAIAANRRIMGEYAVKGVELTLGIIVGIVVVVFNILLIYQTFGGKFSF